MFMKRDDAGLEAVRDILRGASRAYEAGRVHRSRHDRSAALVEGTPLLLALVIVGLTAVALYTPPPPGPPAASLAVHTPADEHAESRPATVRFIPDVSVGPTANPVDRRSAHASPPSSRPGASGL